MHLYPRSESSVSCGYIRYVNATNSWCWSHIQLGTNDAPPVENWRIFRRLIGHENDVQDLGWSYDTSFLVSVGLDSKVVIWSAFTYEKLKTIASHMSHVKGITFDPANKFFATASDDRSIKIWRYTPPGPNSSAYDQMHNFILDKTILPHFALSPLTTYFRRCSWSPDGNHIACANAVNGPVSSVAVINRGQWDGDIHLIGHEGPVEVCAFSPRLFAPHQATGQDNSAALPHFSTVIACAGQDKSLSIWITSNPRPINITQDLAVKAITDLAWTADGTHLFLTSLDGSIIAVRFDPGDLGRVAPFTENDKSLAKFGVGRRGGGVIEGPAGLLLEERSREGELRGAEGRMGALMGDVASSQPPTVNGTAPSTANGNEAAVAPLTNGHTEHPPTKTSEEQSTKPPPQPTVDPNAAKLEKLKSRITITQDGKKRIAPLLVSSSGAQESSLPHARLVASSAMGQIGVNDAPKTTLDLSKPFDGLPQGGIGSLLLGNKRKLAVIEGDDDGRVEKRLALAGKDGATPIMSNLPEGLLPARNLTATSGQQTTPDFIRPAITNPNLTISPVRLAVPKIRSLIQRTLEIEGLSTTTVTANGANNSEPTSNASTQTKDVVFEARNPTRPQDRDPCRVSVTKSGLPVWQDYLPRSVLLATGNKMYWSVACEDGSIYAWTPGGRRMVSAIVLESQPVILECLHQWLLCITAVGVCYVWDMRNMNTPHPPVSLAPVLDIATHSLTDHPRPAPAISAARLNSEGRIIIALTNGDGYAYSPSMYVWQRLSEPWWAVGSQYWNTTDSSVGNIKPSSNQNDDDSALSKVSAGIIPFLERGTTGETLARGRAVVLQRVFKQLLSREGFEGFESSVSIGHLENRVAAALMLGAKEEFRVYLYMYAKRLGAEGLKVKVSELLSGLLGGIHEGDQDGSDVNASTMRTEADRNWANTSDHLCGWSRQELLKNVLVMLGESSKVSPSSNANGNGLRHPGKNRDLQRITVPFAQAYGVTEEIEAFEDAMQA